jgi:hypothetical protein
MWEIRAEGGIVDTINHCHMGSKVVLDFDPLLCDATHIVPHIMQFGMS